MAYLQEEMEIGLSKMKVRELKELATEKSINISKYRTKKEYIACIVQHEALRQAELIHEEDIDRVGEGDREIDPKSQTNKNDD